MPDKKVSSVMKAFDDFKNLFGENFDKVFHTLTTVGGSEFSSLADLENPRVFCPPVFLLGKRHGGKSQWTFS